MHTLFIVLIVLGTAVFALSVAASLTMIGSSLNTIAQTYALGSVVNLTGGATAEKIVADLERNLRETSSRFDEVR